MEKRNKSPETVIKKTFYSWWLNNHQDYDAMLFDVDGTLISGRQALPGAAEMLLWLRNNSFPFFLLTNDGNHSTIEKSDILKQRGLDIQPEEIISCSLALNYLTTECQLLGSLFFIMGDLGTPNYAEEAGLNITRDRNELGR